MNPESNTPRTDAAASCSQMGMLHVVKADFARQLERELAMANDAAEKGAEGRGLGTALEECMKELNELKAAVIEFRDAFFYFDCTKALWKSMPNQTTDDDVTKAAMRKNLAYERLNAALK